MPVTFGGRQCVDPAALREFCISHDFPLSPWEGKANLFSTVAGRSPGRGAVLMRLADVEAIDLAADHELVFQDDAATARLKRLTVTQVWCATPSAIGSPAAVFMVEIADRRLHLQRTSSYIDRAYNTPLDKTNYVTSTLNGLENPWTWAELAQEFWDTIGTLGSWPGLPITPNGVPTNITPFQVNAWDALNDLLERIACAPDYDPVTDTFTIVSIGGEPTAETSALTRLGQVRKTWDDYPIETPRGTRPAVLRVVFNRLPKPNPPTSPYYAVDVSLDTVPGVESDTALMLFDDMCATGDPVNNTSDLNDRAADRAADWVRKFEGRDRRLMRVYRDVTPDVAVVVGGTATRATWEDRGGGLRSELASGPDGRLEAWRPGLVAPPDDVYFFKITEEGEPSTYDGVQVDWDGSGWVEFGGRSLAGKGTRAPSSDYDPPPIRKDQVVVAAPSRLSPGTYLIAAHGSQLREPRKVFEGAYCDGTDIVNVYSYERWYARDLCVSVGSAADFE